MSENIAIEHCRMIRAFADCMTPQNWRDIQLRIHRQTDKLLKELQRLDGRTCDEMPGRNPG